VFRLYPGGSEEDLGSSEESGKDWDELEEEAKKGLADFFLHSRFLTTSRSVNMVPVMLM